ncbi:MAG: hypothetical protein R3C56_36395 [Pirellulaceae bacterium]
MIAASLVAFALLSAEVQAQVRQLTPPKQGSVGTASTVTAASAIDFFNNANDPSDADIRLQVYDVPSELIGPVGAQIQVHFHNVPDVRVTTEPGSGKLMVMAPQSVHREIGAQIDGFMQQNRISAGDRGASNLASTRQQSYDLQHLDCAVWRTLCGDSQVSDCPSPRNAVAKWPICNWRTQRGAPTLFRSIDARTKSRCSEGHHRRRVGHKSSAPWIKAPSTRVGDAHPTLGTC